MTKISQLLWILSFIVLLTGVGLSSIKDAILGSEIERSVTEGRSLSTISAAVKNNRFMSSDFRNAVETAVSDQIFERDALIRLWRRFSVGLMGYETSETVDIGREGFWFQTGTNMYSRVPCASPIETSERNSSFIAESIADFVEDMKSQNTDTLMIVVPLQSTVTPSLLPASIEPLCAKEFEPLQRRIAYLRERGVPVFYDLEFMQESGVEQFYNKKAFHWHRGGAARYSEEAISEYSSVRKEWGQDFRNRLYKGSKSKTQDIDIARYLGVAPMLQEYQNPAYKGRREYRGSVAASIKKGFLENSIRNHIKQKSLKQSKYSQARRSVSNEKVLLIGDSFTEASLEFWSFYYSEVLNVTSNHIKQENGAVRGLVEIFEPDLVIIVFEESKFTPLRSGGPNWRSLGRMFKRSERTN